MRMSVDPASSTIPVLRTFPEMCASVGVVEGAPNAESPMDPPRFGPEVTFELYQFPWTRLSTTRAPATFPRRAMA